MADRVVFLEQALVAVLAAAREKGLDIEDLQKQAIAGLAEHATWRWVSIDVVPDTIEEIARAIRTLKRK